MGDKFDERLVVTKTRISLRHPFYAVIALNVRFILDPAYPHLAATDCCKTIILNPVRCEQLNDDEFIGLIMHELGHIIFMHAARRMGRDNERWNEAGDHAINLVVKRDMGYSLPAGGLYDERYVDMSAEEIYDALPQNNQGGSGSSCAGDLKEGRFDVHLPFPSGEEETVKDMIALANAVWESLPSDKRGTLGAGIQEHLKRLFKPVVPWERKFHRFIGETLSREDYSMTPPNRRYLMYDLYLPSLRSWNLGRVVMDIDVSGSVRTRQLDAFASEAKKISTLIEECTIITSDTMVQQVVKCHEVSQFLKTLEFKGRGGTDHRPVFDAIKEMRLEPELFIGLTDGESIFPEKKPPYPVIWCLTKAGSTPPWGERVYIDV